MAPSRPGEAEQQAFIIEDEANISEVDDERGQSYPNHRRNSSLSSWHAFMSNLRHRVHKSVTLDASGFKSIGTSPQTQQQCPVAIAAVLKRACYIIPVVILMLFGVLHLLQVVIGQARLVWDTDHDEFLPHWGQQGHYGEGLAKYPTDATRDIIPIPCHSHNDYWRRVPLFEAIHYGCTGVEADVWLFDEELYVGHNEASLTKNRTFRSLYVDPIRELLDKQNPTTEFSNTTRHGIFDTSSEQTLVLLVDFKTDGHELWPYVSSQLEPLRERGYLTHFNGEKTISGAVTVVGTGNTPFDLVVENTTYRDIFFDAPLQKVWEMPISQNAEDLEADREEVGVDPGTVMAYDGRATFEALPKGKRGQGNEGVDNVSPDEFNPRTSYYASVSFGDAVGQVWRGHLSAKQLEIIRGQIRGAKRRGLKARYWDTPSWPISLRNHVWHVLMKEGADMLNVDDLRSASRLDWRRWKHEWW